MYIYKYHLFTNTIYLSNELLIGRKSQSQFYSLPFKLAIASMCNLAQESLDISQKSWRIGSITVYL